MEWIKRTYKEAFWTYFIVTGLLAAFAPWLSGPMWLDWLATFLCTYMVLTLWIIARVILASIFRKKDQNSG